MVLSVGYAQRNVACGYTVFREEIKKRKNEKNVGWFASYLSWSFTVYAQLKSVGG